MKVKELIKILEKHNPEAEVIKKTDNFEMGNSYVNLEEHFIFTGTGKKTTRTFRDAFDGEIYEAEIWSLFGHTKSDDDSMEYVKL